MSYQTGQTGRQGPVSAVRLGRYELIGQLATGGMAEIHLARLAGEAGFEKIVVVKRLLPELVASRAYVEMFLSEAKLVAKLDHPNVCEVHELGREGSEYFLVMPFLDGVPVTELIARPRDPDRIAQLRVAAGVIAQACAGLHHAHELRDATGALVGLVHRDVSPSNLFVTTSGVVKVLDFGIAKVAGTAETEAGMVKGKAQYMAPEQLLGEPVDRRADVFGLGTVLYELATHQRLFKRGSDYLAARAILEDPIPRADAADPAIPAALADAISRALERDPKARFADAPALAAALETALAPHDGIASPREIATALAEQHADELSAQRTRQARVVAGARERPTADAPVTDVVTSIRDPAPGTAVSGRVAMERPPPPRAARRALALAIAGGGAAAVLAALGALALYGRADGRRAPTPDAQAATPQPAVRAADVTTVEPSEPATAPQPAHVPKPAKPVHVAATAPKAPGWFSIDSTPFAEISIDDHPVGVTPLVHKPLAAGHHRVRAVLRDGRAKDIALDVPAGKLAAPLTLTW